jgi:phenylpropionate dioxygenase-like ring-hydroxylating dioxygenase large terminal subunit
MNDFSQAPCDAEDVGLFDPNDAAASWTLPADWYYSSEHYAKEHEKIFYKTWIYVGHQSDVSTPGDYLCGMAGDQDIFVIRDEAGTLRAFYNVCSHRAHPLLEGQGNKKLIACPYHQWCYKTDGCFQNARGQENMTNWQPNNADLKPVELEVYGGFVFVNLDPDARPLHEQAPQLLIDMKECCPQLDDLVRMERCEQEVAANWKTLVDNNHECYHCNVNHKSLMKLVDYDTSAIWRDDGITFSHTVERKAGGKDAYAIDGDVSPQGSLFAYIWPIQIPLFFPGSPGLVMFQILPTGPETSRLRHDFYGLNRESSDADISFRNWITNVLAAEDIGLCERVQKGLRSRGYTQGKFVSNLNRPDYSEHHVHLFQSFVCKAMTE